MFSFRNMEFVIKKYATILPLDVFACLGSFIEEIIPPIPAPLVMTTAGSLALTQHHAWIFLLWLAFVGSIGKTFASWFFYVIGDKSEDVIIGKWGRFIGIQHKDIELLGKRFHGGWKDFGILFSMRAIPIFPSVSVSIVAGIVRLNIRTFIMATFLGTVVKNLVYLYAGFEGMKAIGYLSRRIQNVHFLMGILFVIIAVYFIYWFGTKRRYKKEV